MRNFIKALALLVPYGASSAAFAIAAVRTTAEESTWAMLFVVSALGFGLSTFNAHALLWKA